MIPYKTWHKVSDRISILPMKTTYAIRNEKTGKIVKAGGPAASDALMMALYRNEEPTSYAHYCFGDDMD